MGNKRILLLGPTGVDKRAAMERFRAHAKTKLGHDIRFIDFENEFLKKHMGVKNWMTFIAQDIGQQSASWLRAWDEFAKALPNDGVITVLGLHATYVSSVMGLKCPINIPRICRDFAPTLIISLIDDVYNMWHRTEVRAQGQESRGRPDFQQLLVARRAEQILGDLLASHSDPLPRHVLCAAGNSLDALANLIVFDAPATYLSFPISAPRTLAKSGDRTFIELINDAHRMAAAEMKTDRERAFITPLAIDELPLVYKNVQPGADKVEFDCQTDRWDLEELWGSPDLPILPSHKGKREFPLKEVKDATGVIETDVGWRDRRLVLQSHSLAIVSPKPPGEDRITRGVKEELTTAVTMGIACYIWQKPEWDPGGFVAKEFGAGSMGMGQTQLSVRRVGSLEELIKAKP